MAHLGAVKILTFSAALLSAGEHSPNSHLPPPNLDSPIALNDVAVSVPRPAKPVWNNLVMIMSSLGGIESLTAEGATKWRHELDEYSAAVFTNLAEPKPGSTITPHAVRNLRKYFYDLHAGDELSSEQPELGMWKKALLGHERPELEALYASIVKAYTLRKIDGCMELTCRNRDNAPGDTTDSDLCAFKSLAKVVIDADTPLTVVSAYAQLEYMPDRQARTEFSDAR